MTITTTVTISHEELHDLHMNDKSFKELGYNLKAATEVGKVYEKIAWNSTCKDDFSLNDEL
jgi:hypothetical protein